ncbi:MAG: ABC transporter permease [Candidatus Hadarchaeales archaeon]
MESQEMKGRPLQGFLALTHRELKKWYKEPLLLLITILQPLIWMIFLGKAMNLEAVFGGGLPPDLARQLMLRSFGTADYFSFMAIGMIAVTCLFTTMFTGFSIIWDRRLGFLNKVLSTPVSRVSVVFAKVFYATLRSSFQVLIILSAAFALGLQTGPGFHPLYLLGVLLVTFMVCVTFSSLFLMLALRSTRWETPMAMVNLLVMPLMFASNVFFPLELMPGWLKTVASFNPLSYTNDALRQFTIYELDLNALLKDLTYLGLFCLFISSLSIYLAKKYLSR